MMSMMSVGLKRMQKYFAALDSMNANIIEYVGGMEIVKVFGKTAGQLALNGAQYKLKNLTFIKEK